MKCARGSEMRFLSVNSVWFQRHSCGLCFGRFRESALSEKCFSSFASYVSACSAVRRCYRRSSSNAKASAYIARNGWKKLKDCTFLFLRCCTITKMYVFSSFFCIMHAIRICEQEVNYKKPGFMR
jgi:hypothetical protein